MRSARWALQTQKQKTINAPLDGHRDVLLVARDGLRLQLDGGRSDRGRDLGAVAAGRRHGRDRRRHGRGLDHGRRHDGRALAVLALGRDLEVVLGVGRRALERVRARVLFFVVVCVGWVFGRRRRRRRRRRCG